jgi:hypothetical protein
MSVQRGLPRLFHFELVRGCTAADKTSASGEKASPPPNDVAEVIPLRGQAQAIRVLYQTLPDEAG